MALANTNKGSITTLDPKSPAVFRLCIRAAQTMTRNSRRNPPALRYLCVPNAHGYPQIIRV